MSINHKKTLKILITNHHLLSYQGSENFTFVIADYLKQRGHQVFVYSAYSGQLKKDFECLGISVVSDLSLWKNLDFDIAHVHHQINAYEVRYYFPHIPIVLLCHGIIFLENPPSLDLKISQFLATSERVKNHMITQGVSQENILIFRNMVDRKRFFPRSQVNLQPRRALILSNKIDPRTENVIRKACEALKIRCNFIGERFRRVDYKKISLVINEADIVFSLGRGAIESMLCARIPVIFDYEGGDGMVTPSSINQNMTCNFSGNLYNAHYTVEELIDILKKYQANYGEQLYQLAINYFAADKQIENLIQIYYSHLNDQIEPLDPYQAKILRSIVSSVVETRAYSHFYCQHTMPFSSVFNLLRKIRKKALELHQTLFCD